MSAKKSKPEPDDKEQYTRFIEVLAASPKTALRYHSISP
jgi:hypothetical protein